MFLGQNVILTEDQCNDLIEYAKPRLVKSTLGKGFRGKNVEVPSRRASFQTFCNIKSNNFPYLYDIIKESVEAYTNFKLKTQDKITTSIIKYPKGGFLYRHNDTYHEGLRLVGVGNLNDSYKGGDFKTDNGLLKFGKGNFGWFWPNVEHEVTTIKEGERWSMVIWLFNNNLEIKKGLL